MWQKSNRHESAQLSVLLHYPWSFTPSANGFCRCYNSHECRDVKNAMPWACTASRDGSDSGSRGWGKDRHPDRKLASDGETAAPALSSACLSIYFYPELNREVGLLHPVEQGGWVYGIQLVRGDRFSSSQYEQFLFGSCLQAVNIQGKKDVDISAHTVNIHTWTRGRLPCLWTSS